MSGTDAGRQDGVPTAQAIRNRIEAIRTRAGAPKAVSFDASASPVDNALRYVAAGHANEVRFLLSMTDALTALVIALDPEPDEGSTCWVCRCEDSEYDEPHTPDCAYLLARRMVGRGPEVDGGSALIGALDERVSCDA